METTFSVLGSHFRVRADVPSVGAEVLRLLAPFAGGPRPVPGRRDLALVSATALDRAEHCLVVDGQVLHSSSAWPTLVSHLVAEVNRQAIEATPSFAVHAGVVARGRAAVAFPGQSGAGKTTLTAACLLAGFDYASDEALCVGYETGLVSAYPKPLALSAAACVMLGLGDEQFLPTEDPAPEEVLLPPSALGAAIAADPLELAHIVITERRPGPPELAPLPAAEGMAALLGLSFNHYRRPTAAFTLASEAARKASTWILRLDDPMAAGRLLRDGVVGRR